jgi:hypothetical protein
MKENRKYEKKFYLFLFFIFQIEGNGFNLTVKA